jgi:hypothetical protein
VLSTNLIGPLSDLGSNCPMVFVLPVLRPVLQNLMIHYFMAAANNFCSDSCTMVFQCFCQCSAVDSTGFRPQQDHLWANNRGFRLNRCYLVRCQSMSLPDQLRYFVKSNFQPRNKNV